MKIGARPTAAVAMAAVLWTGLAAAEEPAGSRALLALDNDAVEMLSPDELAAASGGQAVTQTAAAATGLKFSKNGVSADRDSQISTGGALSLVGNSGGINNVMTNSGNNVSFQNSTVLNVYLGVGPGSGAP